MNTLIVVLCAIGAVVVAAIVVPFVFYLSVKLCTYAFFRGRQIFQQETENGHEKRKR